jgi:hypothetical protein
VLRQRCRRIAAISAVAAGAAALAPDAAAATTIPDDTGGAAVQLVSPGDPATAVQLPGVSAVGQAAHSTMVMNVSVVVTGGAADNDVSVGLKLELSQEVVEVAADGSYLVLATIDSAEVTDLPAGADAAAVPCIGVTGLQISQSYSASGQLLTQALAADAPTDAEQRCAAQLTQSTSQVVIAFPAEPIGIGATWSVTADVVSQGVAVPVTYHYTLANVADGRYEADITFSSSFTLSEGGSGTMAGTGSLSGAIDNPLNQSASLDVALEITSPLEDGSNATLAMTMEVVTLTS